MAHLTPSQYTIDNASILFLAQMRKDHSNVFRFSMDLTEDVCPTTLQLAVNHIHHRFPTIFAGFRPGIFHYTQVPACQPPVVQPDPGCLLTMTAAELRHCGYRIYYSGNRISIEVFHALTDGYGAICSFTVLITEYFRLKYDNFLISEGNPIDLNQAPQPFETEDSFLRYAGNHPKRLPSRFAYQLPGGTLPREAVNVFQWDFPVETLLNAAHRHRTTINTLISTVMAEAVMEVQQNHFPSKPLPVRIMVPVNLRRIFPSHSLRNFSYYALPTMEPEDFGKSLEEKLHSFRVQIEEQLQTAHLSSVITNNVKLQNSWYFRLLPLPLKCSLMRFICRFFGERTSSITVTNLGNVQLPETVAKYVTHMDVTLTPRMLSPYGCALLSYNGKLSIHISRFTEDQELEQIFLQKLTEIISKSEDL